MNIRWWLYASAVSTMTLVCMAGAAASAGPSQDACSASRVAEIQIGAARTLNNFVTELAEHTIFSGKPQQNYTFDISRDGWVLVAVTADLKAGDDELWVALDGDEQAQAVIVMKPGGNASSETMRRLPAGKHFLCLGVKGKPAIRRVILRTVPEIIYASYRYDPRIGKEFGVFDWEFLDRYVLANINTLNGPSGLKPELIAKHAAEWRRRGGRCVRDTGLPDVSAFQKMPTVEETCKALAAALSQPSVDAVLADECIMHPFSRRILVYADAFKQIVRDPQFKGKTVYPYIAGSAFLTGSFLRRIVELDVPIAVEYYCIPKKTEKIALRHIADHADRYIGPLRALVAEPQQRCVFALFYQILSPCSANIYPQVDFKVFLDMQFHYLANAPGLGGIYGVESYTSGYTDEETLRWTSRLFRHYCIEGRRDRLSNDPYLLPHISNADFADGLEGWEIAMAEAHMVKPYYLGRLGRLMGFWPSTPPGGNDCLWMKRSAKGPNRFSQEIKDLKPGRLYSLKLFTHDVKAPNLKQKHAISIRLENVEILDDRSFQAVYPGDLSSAKKDKKREWLNCHYRLFRPKAERSRLTVSDWQSDTEPGGPVAQELIYDFVQIQPYFEAQ